MKFTECKSIALIGVFCVGLTACGGSRIGLVPVEVAEVTGPTAVEEVAPAPRPEAIRLLNEISALQREIRQLRNIIEEQQFDVENIKQRQQDLYQGLDQRLRVAETRQLTTSSTEVGAAGVVPEVPTGFVVETIEEPLDTASQVTVGGNTVVPEAADEQTTVVVNSGDQQALYDQGFNHLKQSNYNDAILVFEQLVRQHPDGGLADDASYWVGEANYVNRQYAKAIRAFRSVVTQYPSSDRVPEALLKVGYVRYDIGDYENAKITFEDVKLRYPDHPVAISAESRLLRIQRGLTN
ncbi:MAG: tol-pal system protein YbgF [Saprospiraceae bacterium]|jgi:tol-pal system protein YbgF